ncbi:hypothetical protein [Rhodoplanes roseus]|uniref:hypothetical protein n=1 Tax=Rhodoplanes roseus TaxID=29409 RepID=UPI0011B7DA12|nr:hypothetical protein [Rhodoplanes roseus]
MRRLVSSSEKSRSSSFLDGIKKLRTSRHKSAFIRGTLRAVFRWHHFFKEAQAKFDKIDEKTSYINSRLNETEELFLASTICQGLKSWAQMEEALVFLTSVLLNTDRTKAGIVMYSIAGFPTKLNIIDDLFAISSGYNNASRKWNKIKKQIYSVLDDRNRLAHHSIHTSTPEGDSRSIITLSPPRSDARQKALKYSPLTYSEIVCFISKVASISQSLADLVEEMLDAMSNKSP